MSSNIHMMNTSGSSSSTVGSNQYLEMQKKRKRDEESPPQNVDDNFPPQDTNKRTRFQVNPIDMSNITHTSKYHPSTEVSESCQELQKEGNNPPDIQELKKQSKKAKKVEIHLGSWYYDKQSRKRKYLSLLGKVYSGREAMMKAQSDQMSEVHPARILRHQLQHQCCLLQTIDDLLDLYHTVPWREGNGSKISVEDGCQQAWEHDLLKLSTWGLPPKLLQRYQQHHITQLFPWQVDCLLSYGYELFQNKQNFIYSAPTSGGKTLIAELIMLRHIAQMQETKQKFTIFFIVPFIAIAEEKTSYLQEIWQDLNVGIRSYHQEDGLGNGLTSDVEVVVVTIERANILFTMLLEEHREQQVNLMIIDEIHLLSDEQRGFLLEVLLSKVNYLNRRHRQQQEELRQSSANLTSAPITNLIQVIGMSATLPNIEELASWLQASLYVSTYRPVKLVTYLCKQRSLYKVDVEEVKPDPAPVSVLMAVPAQTTAPQLIPSQALVHAEAMSSTVHVIDNDEEDDFVYDPQPPQLEVTSTASVAMHPTSAPTSLPSTPQRMISQADHPYKMAQSQAPISLPQLPSLFQPAGNIASMPTGSTAPTYNAYQMYQEANDAMKPSSSQVNIYSANNTVNVNIVHNHYYGYPPAPAPFMQPVGYPTAPSPMSHAPPAMIPTMTPYAHYAPHQVPTQPNSHPYNMYPTSYPPPSVPQPTVSSFPTIYDNYANPTSNTNRAGELSLPTTPRNSQPVLQNLNPSPMQPYATHAAVAHAPHYTSYPPHPPSPAHPAQVSMFPSNHHLPQQHIPLIQPSHQYPPIYSNPPSVPASPQHVPTSLLSTSLPPSQTNNQLATRSNTAGIVTNNNKSITYTYSHALPTYTFRNADKEDHDGFRSLCLDNVLHEKQTLVFCDSKARCERLTKGLCLAILEVFQQQQQPNIAQGTSSALGSLISMPILPKGQGGKIDLFASPHQVMRTKRLQLIEQLSQNSRAALCPILRDSVLHGIAYHHGGLDVEVRKCLELAFKQGVLLLLFTTSTLAAGVNLPAQQVIIRSLKLANKYISVGSYKQMCGRAGRYGQGHNGQPGEVVLMPDSQTSETTRVMTHLLTAEVNPLVSSLHIGSGGGMEKLLLEMVCCQHIHHEDDVVKFLASTFWYSQRAQEGAKHQVVESIMLAVVNFLKQSQFVLHSTTRQLQASPLGKATTLSGIAPKDAFYVLQSLQQARQKLILKGDLHLVFLITPPYCGINYNQSATSSATMIAGASSTTGEAATALPTSSASATTGGIEPDWSTYEKLLDMLIKEFPDCQQVLEVLSIQPSALLYFTQCKPATNTDTYRLYKRFYNAIILFSLIQEWPITKIQRYLSPNITSGQIQTLQKDSAAFAHMLVTFCKHLNWLDLMVCLEVYAVRVNFGVQRKELLPLVRICADITPRRAHCLLQHGIEDVQDLLSTSEETLANIFKQSLPFHEAEVLKMTNALSHNTDDTNVIVGNGGESEDRRKYQACLRLAQLILKKAKDYWKEEVLRQQQQQQQNVNF